MTAKPCPFCGSKSWRYEHADPHRWIACEECNARGPCWTDDDTLTVVENDASAVRAWNRRPRAVRRATP